jgi:pantoate--beta-alanine ligase
VDIDYVEIVDGDDFQPLERISGTVVLAVAASVGKTRLIDNIKFSG